MNNRSEKDFWIEMSIKEIQMQIRFAELAYQNIHSKATGSKDAVFSSIHSFLSHCAMISKMLTAIDDGKTPKSIGNILGCSNLSTIHNRTFRNHLEHYDERLKTWIREKGVHSNIGTYNIGSKSMIRIPNMVFIKHYNPIDNIFTFVDEEFNLSNLFAEIQTIKNMADQWIKSVGCGAIYSS